MYVNYDKEISNASIEFSGTLLFKIEAKDFKPKELKFLLILDHKHL